MPCCKAKVYGWCSEQDTVHTDSKGNNYCVFHAPTRKRQTQDGFNKIIYKRVQDAIDKKEKCDLSGTIFPGEITFDHFNKDNPLPDLNFSYSIFSGDANFRDTAFNGDADFGKAAFSGHTNFWRAAFRGNASFSSATFSGNASFVDAAFSGHTNFWGAAFSGDTNFWRAAFSGDASFWGAAFSGDANFGKAAFSGQAYFGEVYFIGRAFFRETTFSKDALFRMCSADKLIYFENVELSHVSFIDSDPLMMHFTNCRWPRIFGRNVLFDEIKMKKEQRSFEKVEYFYRRLKQKYKDEYNEPETSNWHYGEKEMFRKKVWLRRYFPFSISNLYWVSSGYGERPMRAGLILLSILIGISVITGLLGLVANEGKSVSYVLWIHGPPWSLSWKQFGFLIYNTIQNSLFIKEPLFIPSSIAGNIFLTLFTKIIIPLQTAFFALSLRNKFRR